MYPKSNGDKYTSGASVLKFYGPDGALYGRNFGLETKSSYNYTLVPLLFPLVYQLIIYP